MKGWRGAPDARNYSCSFAQRSPCVIPCVRTQPSLAIVQELNQRFAAGRPSDDPREAGIAVIVFANGWHRPEDPWNIRYNVNGRASNRIVPMASGSIINRAAPWAMCDFECGAFVLNPDFLRRSFRCGYPQDGNTQKDKKGLGCSSRLRTPRGDLGSTSLARILSRQKEIWPGDCKERWQWNDSCYNELVLDGYGPDGWYSQLPHAVQAIAIPTNMPPKQRNLCCGTGEVDPAYIESLSDRFSRHFNIKSPLIAFDNRHLGSPFSEYRPRALA